MKYFRECAVIGGKQLWRGKPNSASSCHHPVMYWSLSNQKKYCCLNIFNSLTRANWNF